MKWTMYQWEKKTFLFLSAENGSDHFVGVFTIVASDFTHTENETNTLKLTTIFT